MKTADKKNKNLAIPGKPMSQKALADLIKEAEDGPFMSAEEFEKRFEEWKQNRKK
jgi:hypothetical protein